MSSAHLEGGQPSAVSEFRPDDLGKAVPVSHYFQSATVDQVPADAGTRSLVSFEAGAGHAAAAVEAEVILRAQGLTWAHI